MMQGIKRELTISYCDRKSDNTRWSHIYITQLFNCGARAIEVRVKNYTQPHSLWCQEFIAMKSNS